MLFNYCIERQYSQGMKRIEKVKNKKKESKIKIDKILKIKLLLLC
jgi:hypothetical protein